jgi:hypothetical protein
MSTTSGRGGRGRLFPSFFLGGFECSTHRTPEGRRLDVVASTQHDVLAREDYALCRAVGPRAVREAARWPRLDRGGALDLAEVRRLARLGRAAGARTPPRSGGVRRGTGAARRRRTP